MTGEAQLTLGPVIAVSSATLSSSKFYAVARWISRPEKRWAFVPDADNWPPPGGWPPPGDD